MIYFTKPQLQMLERELRSMALFWEAYTPEEQWMVKELLARVQTEMMKRGTHANQGPISTQFTERNAPQISEQP